MLIHERSMPGITGRNDIRGTVASASLIYKGYIRGEI
jgi:hypothetical protein